MSYSPESDPDLACVEQAQRGHGPAFDELVRKYSEKLFGLVYHMTGHKEDTFDLLQEVFSKAYHSLRKFRGQSSFYTWLYAIAVNTTLNHLKKRNRQAAYSLQEMSDAIFTDPALVESGYHVDPERRSSVRELQKKLNEALQGLSDSHRAVVTMFDIQGLPHAEIATILGVSEGTVRSRLHYAHQQLQSQLQQFWEERV